MHRYRLCFSKEKEMRYLSHLDLQRTFIRALRRASIPVALSQGFNPQPRMVFAAPLAVGLEGKNEYVDLYLTAPLQKNMLGRLMQEQLPGGLNVKWVLSVPPLAPPLSAVVEAALYVAPCPVSRGEGGTAIKKILQGEEIIISRAGKKGSREVDIRPFIFQLEMGKISGKSRLVMLLATGSKGGARPEEVLSLFPGEKEPFGGMFRENIFLRNGETLTTPAGEVYEVYLQRLFSA